MLIELYDALIDPTSIEIVLQKDNILIIKTQRGNDLEIKVQSKKDAEQIKKEILNKVNEAINSLYINPIYT